MISHPEGTDVNPNLANLIEQLRQENQQLRRENQDLRIALSTTSEHGDYIEAALYDTNLKLEAEIAERIKAETNLKTLVEIIMRQKTDLEIIVQTLMDHGDILDNQWHQKFCKAVQQADIDGLTQIPNRRKFDEYFAQQWQLALRERSPLAIIMCDVDAFKAYNDTYGHLAGDNCLKQIASTLRTCLQRPGDLAARYGGEEFISLLPHTDLEGATLVAQRIQQIIYRLQIPHVNSPVDTVITVSMGVASFIPDASRTMNQLIRLADNRLYQAKRLGKNCIVNTSER